jgi:hypothetical protein
MLSRVHGNVGCGNKPDDVATDQMWTMCPFYRAASPIPMIPVKRLTHFFLAARSYEPTFVTAPSEAEETSAAYLAKTPDL